MTTSITRTREMISSFPTEINTLKPTILHGISTNWGQYQEEEKALLVGLLCDALNDSSHQVVFQAISSLALIAENGNRETSRATSKLIELLESPRLDIQKRAAWSLAFIGTEGELPNKLIDLVEATSTARSSATFAICMRSSKEIERVKEKSEKVVKALINRLTDCDWNVRENAVCALGNLGSHAIPALNKLNELKSNPNIRNFKPQLADAILESIDKIGAQ